MADNATPQPTLTFDMTADIVVVGAGVAGLTAAYMLVRAGFSVILLDSGAPAGGMTARSTSHIANALDDGWRKLAQRLGASDLHLVAHAYAAGMKTIYDIQASENIACDFAWIDGYLVDVQPDAAVLESERTAAIEAGVPGVTWAERSPFPGAPEARALKFAGEARLHPVKYANGLATRIKDVGAQIFQANVIGVRPDERAPYVETANGSTVKARKGVILATNSGLKFAVPEAPQAAYRSYVIAAPVPRGSVIDAVCWDLEDPYHYTRLQPGTGGEDILIVGGEDHEVGLAVNIAARFSNLEAWARQTFPAMGAPVARWTGNIKQTEDNLAFLGRSAHSKVFFIDGDGGLGFNHATIGAMIIRDLLTGAPNAWVHIFDPGRFGPVTHPLLST